MTMRAYYESQAEVTETGAEIDGRVRKAARMFEKHLGRADRLLDIGCGVGSVGLFLGRALGVSEIYGVEVSEKRAEAASARGLGPSSTISTRARFPSMGTSLTPSSAARSSNTSWIQTICSTRSPGTSLHMGYVSSQRPTWHAGRTVSRSCLDGSRSTPA